MRKIRDSFLSWMAKASMILLCLTGIQSYGQQSKPAVSGYAPVNGLKVYYEVYGEGEPIVLLHGAFMSIDMNWGQFIPMLAKTRKVIALELQGHGRTADIERSITLPALASDVAGVMKYLKIDRADILGYSFGGTVAYQFIIKYPELVRKLIIVSSVYREDGWLPEMTAVLKSFKPDFLDNSPLETEYKRLAPDTAHWHHFLSKMIALEQTDFNLGDDNIKKIKSPVLLISGDNDGVDHLRLINTYRMLGGGVGGDIAGLPKSQLAIVPGKTHVSLMMDFNSIFSIVEPFLKGAEGSNGH